MDGVYDLKSLEDVIPADDEEACGTTLCVGQACHATYADGEDYEASVIFVSEDKDDCLKQMKILASKKTTKVKDHRKNTKLPADNIDSSSAKKKKTSEPDKPTATKKKPNVNKQKAKKAVTLQLQSRKAAATACAKQIVEGMLERNITLAFIEVIKVIFWNPKSTSQAGATGQPKQTMKLFPLEKVWGQEKRDLVVPPQK